MSSLRWLSLLASGLLLVTPVPAHAAPENLTTAADRNEPTVARIDTTLDFQGAVGAGTGIVLEPAGAVLTNFHVVNGADTITASVGGRQFPADLVGYDRGNDLAVVQARDAADLPAAALGQSSGLVSGVPVVALGNADGSASPLTRERGVVTEIGRGITAQDALTGSSEDLDDLIAFDAPVRAGDSGGPLINDAGQVVGITTAATANFRMEPGGQGFAIPIDRARTIADQIRSGVPTADIHIGPPALLGVGVRDDGPAAAPGVLVREAVSGGPAEQAGIRPGDTITALAGTPVASVSALTDALDRQRVGDVVDVALIDPDGVKRGSRVTLAAGGA